MVDMLLKAGANPSAVGSVCIWHERDKNYDNGSDQLCKIFIKSNRSFLVSLVASLK